MRTARAAAVDLVLRRWRSATTEDVVLSAVNERGIATLTLNRPEVHNAYNGAMIDALIETVDALAADPLVRLLVLRANGKNFQAGADLDWPREVAGFALEDNVAFSRRTMLAMRAQRLAAADARAQLIIGLRRFVSQL